MSEDKKRKAFMRALTAYLEIKPEDLTKSKEDAMIRRINKLSKEAGMFTTVGKLKRRTGGMDMMKKKGYARGGAKMKKMRAGGGKMPMAKDPKTGKMIPTYAMDGKGKMRAGGTMKKKGMARGGMKKKGYARGGTARRK